MLSDADAHEARDRPGRHQPRDAAQVVDRGAHDRDARVRVVDPVDRHLVDPQPAPLGEHEQLGVEEPAVVADVVEQPRQRVARTALKPHCASEKRARSAVRRITL